MDQELLFIIASLVVTLILVIVGIYGHKDPDTREITCLQCNKTAECEDKQLPIEWLAVQRDDGTHEHDLYCCVHCLLDSLGSGERVDKDEES